jgi:hypothetical protein
MEHPSTDGCSFPTPATAKERVLLGGLRLDGGARSAPWVPTVGPSLPPRF